MVCHVHTLSLGRELSTIVEGQRLGTVTSQKVRVLKFVKCCVSISLLFLYLLSLSVSLSLALSLSPCDVVCDAVLCRCGRGACAVWWWRGGREEGGREEGEGGTNRTIWLLVPPKFPSGYLRQDERLEESGTCCSRHILKLKMGKIQCYFR